jgi:uncharacterized protein with HEPN domain
MKKRTYKMFVEDMLEAMDKIDRYTKGLAYEKFVKNSILVDEVIGNLEIIGEASVNIPEDVREEYPNIPWGKMIELSNVVDLGIVWEIITKDLSETRPKIIAMLKSFSEEE